MKINNKNKAIREILKSKVSSREDLMVLKRKISKKYGIAILSNSELLKIANAGEKEIFKKILRKRSVRTLSGIAPVAVLTKPFPCPGKCAYCPTEKDVPQSYLSNEPAVMRAIRSGYDPYLQTQTRLQALEANGHNPNKIEIIVIGGTWSVLPEKYKYWYIKEVFRAANEHRKNFKFQISNFKSNPKSKIKKIEGLKKELLEEQKKNEKAKYKIIGLTLETRPDYINEKELLEMRELGCTRVELGVQAVDDKILKLNKRGHGIKAIVEATKLLKDFGFKVTYHVMPALPGSTPAKDLKMFKILFSDERFQPDQIKFYPTVVTQGSLLHKWWRVGKYKPYIDKTLQKLIVDCKKVVPPYVRIIRLIRDIPSESIIAGNKITNLRQVMQQRGVKCSCIRCREAKEQQFTINNLQLTIIKYGASGGDERFIQATSKDKKILYGFCRLRLNRHCEEAGTPADVTISCYPQCSRDCRVPITGLAMTIKEAALIRELHVYGELVPVPSASSGRVEKKVQHAGLGKLLMQKAEEISRKNKYKKIAVISGIGARGYYKKLGFKLKDSYMVKVLN